MSLPTHGPDVLQVSRYECKYFLSETGAAAVRREIMPFVEPDRYAAVHPDHRYPLSSLYLDSSDLALYRQSAEGTKNRFKLRIRTYSDDPGDPTYVEIKKRTDQIVMKRRAAVDRRPVGAWLGDFARSPTVAGVAGVIAGLPAQTAVAGEFASLAHRIAARPVMRVRYIREAYESARPGAVRITFDRDVMYALSPGGELGLGGETWRPMPADGVILEMKFTEHFPSWIRALIDSVQLQKQSIPKYALSVADALSNLPAFRSGASGTTWRSSQ